jgi:hypothetical protein
MATNINGIVRSVEKHTQQTVAEYDGYARPGELVVDLTTYQLYIGNADGNLHLVAGSGGTPGGLTTQVQFNDSGSFAGSSAFTYNKSNGNLTLAGNVNSGNLRVTGTTDLNNISNITITGGLLGQAVVTDGAGVLAWGNISIITSGTTLVNAGLSVVDIIADNVTGVTVSSTGTSVYNGLYLQPPTIPSLALILSSYSYASNIVPTKPGAANIQLRDSNNVYYTVSPTANYTLNFVLADIYPNNVIIAPGYTISCTIWVKQSSIAYTLAGVSINGIPQTILSQPSMPVETANTLTQYKFQITGINAVPITYMVMMDRTYYTPVPT